MHLINYAFISFITSFVLFFQIYILSLSDLFKVDGNKLIDGYTKSYLFPGFLLLIGIAFLIAYITEKNSYINK